MTTTPGIATDGHRPRPNGSPRPLFPLPLEHPAYPQRGVPDLPDESDPSDWISMAGYCHSFCEIDGPNNTNEDHGPTCDSAAFGGDVDGWELDGTRVNVFTDLVGLYTNGIYHRSVVYRRHPKSQAYLRLTLMSDRSSDPDEQGQDLHLTSRDARALAAKLLFGADALDRLDQPITNAAAAKCGPRGYTAGRVDAPEIIRQLRQHGYDDGYEDGKSTRLAAGQDAS